MRFLTPSTVHPGLVDLLVLLKEPDSNGRATVEQTASVRRLGLRCDAIQLSDAAVGYMVNELRQVSSSGGVLCSEKFSFTKSV